jgi:hypothetical protein
MQLENLLSGADPARQAQIDEADSPHATALYGRIVGTPPSLGGGGVRTSAPGRADIRACARRRTTRMVPRRSALAAVATAVVVAAGLGLVALAGGSRGPHDTLAGGGAPSTSPPRSSTSPRPSPSPSQPARLNQAGAVLDALAAVAAGRPPTTLIAGPGNYLYVLDIELKGAPPGGGTSMACGSVIRQEWLAGDSSGRQVIDQPGCVHQSRIVQSWPKGGNGINFDYFDWEDLPTEPAAMEAAIVKRFEAGHSNNAITFLVATSVLNVAAPPAVRAAVFRMLATVPRVHYLGKVTDPLGRTGDTIALVQKPDDLVAMFDPKTGQVLDALLVPYTFRLARHLPPWATPEMYVKIGIVGSITATPPGTKKLLSEIPYRHWVS